MNKVIKNAKIVNSRDTYCADVRIQDGVIAEIGQNITPEEGCTVIDAAGKYLIPGAVDGHTHMMDPGYTDRETFAQGTAAAAVGGTTTVIDHHRTDPLVHTAEILREKIEYLSDKAVVDFGLDGGSVPENIRPPSMKPMASRMVMTGTDLPMRLPTAASISAQV